MAFSVLFCCQCGSHLVDVNGWRSRSVAVLHCAGCGHESPVSGFTVGRVWRDDAGEIVQEAISDVALPRVLKAVA